MNSQAQAPTYSRSDLTREIARHYDLIKDRPEIRQADLATAVLSGWPETDIEQDKWCRAELVHESVQGFIRQRKLTENTGTVEKQSELPNIEIRPGHTRLQKAYAFERRGELAIVHLEHMTSAERQAKARAMEKGAAGLMEHADELRRYDQENPSS